MIKSFFHLIAAFFSWLKLPLAILGGFVFLFLTSCSVFFFIHRKEFQLKPHSSITVIKQPNFLKKLFILAPAQVVRDLLNRPPDFFKPQGLIIFEGRQGSGKTSTMTREIMLLQQQYPKCKVITNFGYTKQDDELKHWKQLITYKNGYMGVIVGMDELQNWFSSKQSATFPPEMLSVVTQNRKNRRVIFGTAQNFYMLAKDIRTQCTELRSCLTLLGCITIVHRRQPVTNSAGEVEKLRHLGWYWYVHSSEQRESYDTWKAIESLAVSGFKDPLPEGITISVSDSSAKQRHRR